MRNSFFNLIKIKEKYVNEGFHNTQMQNCQPIATIRFLSSKYDSVSNPKVMILFGTPVKTNSVKLKTRAENVYMTICFSERKTKEA